MVGEMKYGSVCSGIEAATAAWHGLGWQPSFFSEIEPFPRAVLTHHYPHVPLHEKQAVAGTICRNSFVGGAGGRPEGAAQGHFLQHGSDVRRLTPRECERLQGFSDDYTLVPHRGKPAADSPRYKALGNSMAVPVMRWIGQRIAASEHQHAA